MARAQETKNPFSAFMHHDFRLLWIGLGTGGVGDAMQRFALGWYVVQLAVDEGQPQLGSLYLGLLGLTQGLPGIALGPFAGVLADRMDRRQLLLLSRAGSMAVVVGLALVILTAQASIAPILVLSFIGSVAASVDFPTRQSILSLIVPERNLTSAVGLTQASGNASMLVGPLIGGILISPLGVGGLMLLNAATSIATILALVLLRPLPLTTRRDAESVARSLADGIAFVLREPVLRWVVVLGALVGILARPYIPLMPAFAAVSLGVGAVELSWLLAAVGLGTLVGSICSGALGGLRRTGAILVGSVMLLGLLLVIFAAQQSFAPALIIAAMLGFHHFMFAGISFALMQTRTPQQFRGRAVGIFITTLQGFGPLGALLLGSFGAVVGVGVSLALGGAIVAVVAAYVLFGEPVLRDLTSAPAGTGNA